MSAGTETYERNTKSSKFYSSAVVGHFGYNPTITEYYTASGILVRVEEVFKGNTYSQTISGSNYDQQWPNYTYTETYYPWEEVTAS